MAHVFHLSLLLAVSLLPCVSAIPDFPNGEIKIIPCDLCAVGWIIKQNCDCTAGKWILKFECGVRRVHQVTLKATKLSNPGMTNICPKITYTTSIFLLSVEVEAGCVKISGVNNICRSCNTRVTFSPPSNKAINCISGQKIHISVPKPDQKRKVWQVVHEVYDISDCIDAQTGSYPRPCNVSVTTTSTPAPNLEFYHENKSWIDALEQCQNDYTSLVEITNQTVNDEVKSLLQNETHLQQGVWIGLERSVFGKDRKWMWISKSKDIYPKWNSSIDDLNNHCAKMILTEQQEIKLLDANCHDRLPFICQDFGEDAP